MFGVKELNLLKISNGALKGDGLPTRLKFFNWGDNSTTGEGNFRVNEKSQAGIAAQKDLGFERVAIDFNHCSVQGSDTYKECLKEGIPPLIFGSGRPVAVPNDGLYLEDIIWTPLGRQHAKNFEDISPTPHRDADGNVDFVHSIALCPNGKVEGLHFFSAILTTADLGALDTADSARVAWKHISDPENRKKYSAADLASHEGKIKAACKKFGIDCDGESTTKTLSSQSEKFMKDTPLTLLSVCQLLGLPETTNEADVLKKLGEHLQRTAAGSTDLTQLSAKLDAVVKRLDDAAAAGTEAERGRIITLLSAEGKAPVNAATGKPYSAEELAKLDLTLLKALHVNTPVTVPLSARHATGMTDGARSFVPRDKDGKINGSVDLAGIFQSEARANRQLTPDALPPVGGN